jgi:nucleoside transporter
VEPTPRLKLFVMMALQFFIWGAWLPLVWSYMDGIGFSGTQQAWIGSAFAIASIVGIFFSNQFADRTFAAERFLAFSHLVGGLAMLGLWFTRDFGTFFALMLVHSLFYVPTISVTNAIAFAHLKDPQREFGPVRMGGTIGWIAAAWPLYFILQGVAKADVVQAQSAIFLVSGIAALVLAGYALVLPHTPPRAAQSAEDRFAWLKAGKKLAVPYVLVLFGVTFLDATIHDGYFLLTGGFLGAVGFGDEWIMPIMSLGQVAEIGTMAVLGLVLARLGWRATMVLGVLGHAARFAVFAFCPDLPWAIVAVQVLHGICYAFFFATVYIFVDATFPKDARASAQGWFNLLILGLGPLVAKWTFLPLKDALTAERGVDPVTLKVVKEVDYQTLFLVPTLLALVGAVVLALFFRPPAVGTAAPADAAAAH